MGSLSSWELVSKRGRNPSDENKQEYKVHWNISLKLLQAAVTGVIYSHEKKEMHSRSVSISYNVALQYISESLLVKDCVICLYV